MAKHLELSSQEWEALPKKVQDALFYNKPVIVIDIVKMDTEPSMCMSFQGELFDLTRGPCRDISCKYYLQATVGPHFHSSKGNFVLRGKIDIDGLRVDPVGQKCDHGKFKWQICIGCSTI